MAMLMSESTIEPTIEPVTALPVRSAPWPRAWADQAILLERQHDRLEACLQELLQRHGLDQSAWSGADALALDGACRRLLWDLGLHFRLEERWLCARGCLCIGHRQAHRDGIQAAIAGFQHANGDHRVRHHWLLALQDWFLDHRHGPDARAYALAHRQS